MAVLNTADRKAMPNSDFGGPGRTFPMQDRGHQRLAISGATRSEHAGNISQSEEEKIKSEARAKLGEKGGDPPTHDHKVAVAKMHPEHLHKLVKDAHEGKYGPEAQKSAQQAMQPPSPAEQQGGKRSYAQMFSGANDNDEDDASPVSAGQMFSGR